jgi:hypothetical protein
MSFIFLNKRHDKSILFHKRQSVSIKIFYIKDINQIQQILIRSRFDF